MTEGLMSEGLMAEGEGGQGESTQVRAAGASLVCRSARAALTCLPSHTLAACSFSRQAFIIAHLAIPQPSLLLHTWAATTVAGAQGVQH
jgi:hypothetical protein